MLIQDECLGVELGDIVSKNQIFQEWGVVCSIFYFGEKEHLIKIKTLKEYRFFSPSDLIKTTYSREELFEFSKKLFKLDNFQQKTFSKFDTKELETYIKNYISTTEQY